MFDYGFKINLLVAIALLLNPSDGLAVEKCRLALKTISLGEVSYEISEIESEDFFQISPLPIRVSSSDWESPVVKSIGRLWNKNMFLSQHHPHLIGVIKNQSLFSEFAGIRVLDMPIKFPNTDVRVPTGLVQFKEAIQAIINYERAINPDYEEYYAYITVDQKVIHLGSTHRRPGAHVDGIQGRAYPRKLRVDHSYLIADREPTVFYTHPFDLREFDVNVHNFNTVFAAQANPDERVQPQPFEITMMDAFSVHESPIISESGPRTLLRIEFSEKKYNRLGNTHNPHFDYRWEMIPRPIPEDLE